MQGKGKKKDCPLPVEEYTPYMAAEVLRPLLHC